MAKMADRQSKTLFVRNLPFETSNEKLLETYEQVGPVKTAFVVAGKEPGKCRGFGYVQFSMLEDAIKAKETVTRCGGRKIAVSFADTKRNWKTKHNHQKEKKELSAALGETQQPQPDGKSAQKPEKKKESKEPKLEPGKRCRLIIRNLAFKCKEADIRSHFEKFGTLSDVTIPLKQGNRSRGFAFVQFTEVKAAQKAISNMNGTEIMDRPVAVDWAVAKDRFEASTQQKQQASEESEEEEEEDKMEEGDETDNDSSSNDNQESDDEDVDDSNEDDDDDESEEDNEDSDDDSGASDEDSDKEESSSKKDSNKTKPPRKSDVEEGRTLFIRNVPFGAEEEEVEEVFEEFGELAYVRLVIDKVTGQSRGTAFVQFKEKEAADQCLAKSQDTSRGGGLRVQGRPLFVVAAVSRTQAQTQKEAEKSKEQKDNRNLFLAREGLIRAGTQAAEGMSQEDIKKRMKVEMVKREKLKNVNIFVSSTRLCVHNLLPSVDEKQLKTVVRKVVDDSTMKITECRVMRDLARTNQSGQSKSLGYAFVNFSTHEHALKALRALNNSSMFGDSRRPIVEFSLENKKALEAKQKRLEKSRVQAAKKKESGGSNPKQKSPVDKTQDRIAKKLHSGAPKGMPKRFGPKVRHRNRGQPEVSKKKNKKQMQAKKPVQQPKPKSLKKKKGKEVPDKLDKMVNKRLGKKSRWFET